MGRWSSFGSDVRQAGGEWVVYAWPSLNPKAAQQTAYTMRQRWPEFEIKTVRGVIHARLRKAVA